MLIDMPAFERQFARYPQLYSRIGFAHQYQPIDPEDVPTRAGPLVGTARPHLDPADREAQAANAITAITGGNFRLIERLMT